MKKLIIPVLLLCLLLSACVQNTDPTQPIGTDPTVSSSPTSHNNQPLNHNWLTFDGIEEYREFIEMADPPDDFVRYEQLTQFGEFWVLVILSPKSSLHTGVDYSQYQYGLVAEDGGVLHIKAKKIDPNLPLLEHNNIVDSKWWGDMQAGDPFIDKTNACVIRNNISYLYLGGALYSVSWESNGIWFSIVTDRRGGVFYPEDGPLTIVHELLHTDTNKAALEKINAALETPVVK